MAGEAPYPRFSDAEYARRYADVRARMDKRGVEALVLVGLRQSAEIHYLTNWRTTTEAYAIFPREGESTLLVQLSNHLPVARQMAVCEDIRFGGSSATGGVDSVPSVIDNLKERGLAQSRIGLVGPVPYQHYHRFREAFPDAEWVDFSGEMRDQRIVKSEEEMDWYAISAQMCDRGMQALADQAKPGIPEHRLAQIVEDAYLGDGGINGIHFMITTSMHDPQGGVPRQYMTDRIIQKGDVLVVENTANYCGYGAQILRTYTIGAGPTPEYGRMHEVAMTAFAATETILRDGATVADVLEAADVVHQQGFTVYDDFLHGSGQLPPILRTRQTYRGEPPNFVFKENMCVVVQPNVITPDCLRGVQFGEHLRITKTGTERVHQFPRQLIVCDI